MCGIAGYYSFGDARPSKKVIGDLLVETQSRGTDATGVAWVDGAALRVVKQPLPADKFVETEDWKEIELPKIMIMHCRATTQGKESENMNNHPTFTKSGIAVVHNGILWNDDRLFKAHSLERDAEVDSEIFAKLFESVGGDWDEGIKLVNEVTGSFACAAIQTSKPDELLLWRHDKPIVFAYDKEKDILYFASTDEIMNVVTSEIVDLRGFSLYLSIKNRFVTWEMGDDTGTLIGSSGKIREYMLDISKKSSWERYERRDWWGDWPYTRRDYTKDTSAGETPTVTADADDDDSFNYCLEAAWCTMCGCGVFPEEYRKDFETYICDDCMDDLPADGPAECHFCKSRLINELGRCGYCGAFNEAPHASAAISLRHQP